MASLDMASLDMTLDDDAIQVADDEIESAEPARPTLTSGLPSFADTLSRSRPPSPPSLRPRASSTSLPPPRRSSRADALLRSSLPPPSYPSLHGSESRSERDPWLLANKTLELSRANARISTLEDQIAFRDARILTLEERLDAAQLKIEELERKRDALPLTASITAPASTSSVSTNSVSTNSVATKSVSPSSASVSSASANSASASSASLNAVSARSGATAPTASRSAAPVARNASKPAIAIPKPADVAKASEARASEARAAEAKAAEAKPAQAKAAPAQISNGKSETAREDALTPEPPEAGGSIFPEADEEQATGAAVPPSGPEDVRRIAGIGTRFEAALRKQGITSIRQIAAWSDADVRQVAKALKIPKSRIVKGGWIEAAREMIGSRSTSE
jgi:NADH-quinone oxidoreductase subunit E